MIPFALRLCVSAMRQSLEEVLPVPSSLFRSALLLVPLVLGNQAFPVTPCHRVVSLSIVRQGYVRAVGLTAFEGTILASLCWKFEAGVSIA